MDRFVELTLNVGGKIFVDVNQIVAFEQQDKHDWTTVQYVDMTKEGGIINVTETIDVVALRINEAENRLRRTA